MQLQRPGNHNNMAFNKFRGGIRCWALGHSFWWLSWISCRCREVNAGCSYRMHSGFTLDHPLGTSGWVPQGNGIFAVVGVVIRSLLVTSFVNLFLIFFCDSTVPYFALCSIRQFRQMRKLYPSETF